MRSRSLLSSPQFFVPASPSTTCCEAAPRSGPDASSAPAAASLCCSPYESRLLAPGRAELNAALGMYGAPYAAGQGYGNYLPYSAEPAALYTALVSADRPGAHRWGRGVCVCWGGGGGVQQAANFAVSGRGGGGAEGRGSGAVPWWGVKRAAGFPSCSTPNAAASLAEPPV